MPRDIDEATLHVVVRCDGALGSSTRSLAPESHELWPTRAIPPARYAGRVYPIHDALDLNSSNTRERNTAASDATLSVLDNAPGYKSRHWTCAPGLPRNLKLVLGGQR